MSSYETNPRPDATPEVPTNDVDYDDPKRPLLRAVKLGSWALVILTVVSLAIWGATRELPGIWGVLIGAAIGGGFVLFTALSVLFTANTSASTTLAVVLGGWLVKIVILILILAWLRSMDFYDQAALGVTTIAALVVVLATETWGVITTRVTYVS